MERGRGLIFPLWCSRRFTRPGGSQYFALRPAATSLWFGWRYRLSQLERARATQQAFSRQLIASQENERKRIAAELHDSLGQRLVIIQNQALLLLQTRAGVSRLDGSQRERVEEISAEASGAVREVKELSYNLRPYRLDRLGLTAALQAMIDTASGASQTAFSVEIDNIDDVFPKQTEINFYRIVQECINNILKHSQAAEASIRIRRANDLLTLTVRDDGKGFAPDSGTGGFAGRLRSYGYFGASTIARRQSRDSLRAGTRNYSDCRDPCGAVP